MPVYNAPSLISDLFGDDVVLIWQTSSGANKTITGQDLADSLNALMDFDLEPVFVTSALILSTERFVVANSGAVFTVSLPSSIAYPGRRITIYNKGAATVTIARTGTDVIGTTTSITLPQGKGSDFISDGTGVWCQLGT